MSATPELPQHFVLVNGRKIPSIGLGTFQADAGNDMVRSIVAEALRQGYCHIDTAADYGNEEQVGQGIQESGVSREEIFGTTKLSVRPDALHYTANAKLLRANNWHQPEDVSKALDISLQNFQLDYDKIMLPLR